MPQVTLFHIGMFALAAIAGALIGWVTRSRRCLHEKIAVNSAWQEQLDAQQNENDRFIEQNKHLMQQVNEAKLADEHATGRIAELSEALEDMARQRDELRKELQDIQDNLKSGVESLAANDDTLNSALIEKDNKIFRLSRELNSWQNRLPPLIERFRQRDAEAEKLEVELAEAEARILALQSILDSDETRIEPIDVQSIPNGMTASNEPILDTSENAGAPMDRLRDDLKIIKGIGPSIERTLNELGFFRLSQIAGMSEYDINRVANRLRGFRPRILREDWIGQARQLQQQRPAHRF